MATKNTTTAIAPRLSAADITAILQGAGAIDSDSGFNRMKTDGSMFVAGDKMWPYNPVTNQPAFIARLMAPPEQYQGLWWTPAMAAYGDREADLNTSFDNPGFMCKSYYDKPNQARNFSESGAPCDACAFNPFKPTPDGFNQRCSWRGDLMLQIVPDDGMLKGDEPVYTLPLSTTAMIEFRGTRKERVRGSATDKNFMHRLAELAITKADEWKVDPETAIRLALSSLNGGGVAAEFRIIRATNDNKTFQWSVPSLTPIHIEHPDTEPDIPELAPGDIPI